MCFSSLGCLRFSEVASIASLGQGPSSKTDEAGYEKVFHDKSACHQEVNYAGGKQNVRPLEDAFWDGLHEIAASKNMTISGLIAKIDNGRNILIFHLPSAYSC